ncbi:type II secretion system F family protein [Nocardioides limicola]|uniref:type II secretion system F family protein n=1 Tax=Nocardioides limicola TaxID=2803368 RepID=UPI001EF09404|nr:type II secretion system F family protein [Nocardioides sp. DJM-14]
MMVWGALLGGMLGFGVWLTGDRLWARRRPSLAVRVLPHLADLPRPAGVPRAQPPTQTGPWAAAAGVFGPALSSTADAVGRILGGATAVRQRLRRAGLETDVAAFRVEQVLWGFAGLAVVALPLGIGAFREPSRIPTLLILGAVAFVVGVLARDTWLTSQAKSRERQILTEFPTIAELLALAVAAGESPVSALDRVVRRSGGAMSQELARVLAEVRTGMPVAIAFDRMASSTGLPLVARFAQGVAVAVERGTPLADVLHAQAADVREAGRRQLIETAARKEVLMMVPVVFLVLPVTIVFAFYPGLIGLNLTTP